MLSCDSWEPSIHSGKPLLEQVKMSGDHRGGTELPFGKLLSCARRLSFPSPGQGGWQRLSGLMLRTSQLLSHQLSLNPQVAFQDRHRYPYITDEKTSVCVESRLKVAFSYLSP